MPTFRRPGSQRRWTIALRFFIALPALVLAGALSGGLDGGGGSSQGDDAESYAFSFGGLGTAIAFLAWFASLALARTPGGLRDAQVYCQGYAAQAFGYLLLLSDRYPTSDPDAIPLDPMPAHPVRLHTGEDRSRNRLTVAFRLILAIPHVVWLALWSIAAFFVSIAAWLATLGDRPAPRRAPRLPRRVRPLRDHVAAYIRHPRRPVPRLPRPRGQLPGRPRDRRAAAAAPREDGLPDLPGDPGVARRGLVRGGGAARRDRRVVLRAVHRTNPGRAARPARLGDPLRGPVLLVPPVPHRPLSVHRAGRQRAAPAGARRAAADPQAWQVAPERP